MNLVAKFRETSISVLPIMVIVLIVNFSIAPLEKYLLLQFFIGGILLIVGLSIFLLGADIGLLPIGEKVGAALVKKRNLPAMLMIGFLIGFMVTIAEPDIQILAIQIATIAPSIHRTLLILMIAAGVGLFVSLGLARIVLQVPLKYILRFFYIIVFICAFFTKPEFLGIAFDAGGATTGPMTVPFILALGVGVAAVQGGKNTGEDSFGLTGMASIGPILAVLILGMIFHGNATNAENTEFVIQKLQTTVVQHFLELLPHTLIQVTQALVPLAAMFLIFQILLLHMPPYQLARMIKGLIYTFIGLVIFLIGVKGGFMPAGQELGGIIGSMESNWILIPIGLLLGAVVVCAEPAVWVLMNQVEKISGGHIKKIIMLATLSLGVAFSVGLSMIRVLQGISLWWFLIPGYTLALLLTHFCPQMFTAIAFDSGGVASGPMSSTFILSFTLGASISIGGNPITDAFGVVAMIAMAPLLTIQILGLIFKYKERKASLLRKTTEVHKE